MYNVVEKAFYAEVYIMLNEKQSANYRFFQSHLGEYLDNPLTKGKFGVFFNESLQGTFDSFDAAYSEACSKFPTSEFIIQQLVDSSEVVDFLWSAVV